MKYDRRKDPCNHLFTRCPSVPVSELPSKNLFATFSATCELLISPLKSQILSTPFCLVHNDISTSLCFTVLGILMPMWIPHAPILHFYFLLFINLSVLMLLLAQPEELRRWENIFVEAPTPSTAQRIAPQAFSLACLLSVSSVWKTSRVQFITLFSPEDTDEIQSMCYWHITYKRYSENALPERTHFLLLICLHIRDDADGHIPFPGPDLAAAAQTLHAPAIVTQVCNRHSHLARPSLDSILPVCLPHPVRPSSSWAPWHSDPHSFSTLHQGPIPS